MALPHDVAGHLVGGRKLLDGAGRSAVHNPATGDVIAEVSLGGPAEVMAASVMVAVTGTDHIITRLTELARRMVPGRDYGPVISAVAKARIEGYITEGPARSTGAFPSSRARATATRRRSSLPVAARPTI
jgi:acyl-CoA reductase-like NAD-dependent aldehyde dehydrogenase